MVIATVWKGSLQPLFQCQYRTQTNTYSTPNICDFYFNSSKAAMLFRNKSLMQYSNLDQNRALHVYPGLMLGNCTGTINRIEYCYSVRSNRNANSRMLFDLLSLHQNGPRNFLVTKNISISSQPRHDNCFPTDNTSMRNVCCSAQRLSEDEQFNVHSNFSFGLLFTRQLLFFSSNKETYRANSFERPMPISNTEELEPQLRFPARSNSRRPIPLMRFFIEPNDESPDASILEDSTCLSTSAISPTEHEGTLAPVVYIGGSIAGAVILVVSVTVLRGIIIIWIIKRQGKEGLKRDCKHNAGVTNNTYAGSGPSVTAAVIGGTKRLDPQDCSEHYTEIKDCGYEMDDVIYTEPTEDEDSLIDQLQTKQLSRNFVGLGENLGSGQFGVVYRGVLECGEGEGGKVEVAVKTLKKGSGEEDRVKFLQEAAIMGQFKDHNVVTMYGVVTDGEPVLLVLELLLKGDLREYLLQIRPVEDGEVSMDDHTLLSYCRQVASGMAYLSSKAFVHRDLAARNILVSDNDICKIADFGMARDLLNKSYYISHGGKIPVKWTAPEALHYKKYSTASDMWSYGALMYEIWSLGHKPFEEYNNNEVLKLLGTGYRLPPPPGCPRLLYDIMISCWHPESSERPSFQDVTKLLSLPDPKLLKWSEEDKAVHPEAAKLGADLFSAQNLYKDLQTLYK